MEWTRRSVFCLMPTLLGFHQLSAEETKALPSKVYRFDELPVRTGNPIIRNILSGSLHDGFHVSLHESDLGPNSIPHEPHRHEHEEMVFVLEGTLEFTVNGKPTRAGAGSVLFAGSNDMHGIRNPDTVHAKYFVLALGPENR
jgi:mannose-6-phosphate isomerase-like protein (cupin superfamily)